MELTLFTPLTLAVTCPVATLTDKHGQSITGSTVTINKSSVNANNHQVPLAQQRQFNQYRSSNNRHAGTRLNQPGQQPAQNPPGQPPPFNQ